MPILVRTFLEQMPHAAQIAGPLLAHVGDEQEIGAGLHAGGIHRAQPGKQHRKRARVVADAGRIKPRSVTADGEVRAGRKHGIEMRRDADQRTIARARPQPRHIALCVDLQVPEAVRLCHREEGAGTVRLVE